MTKSFLAAAIVFGALASPALAAAEKGIPFSFQAEGQTYDVVRVDTPRGAILSGVDSSHAAFRLVVVGTHVSGTYGSNLVNFNIAAPISPHTVAMQ